MRHAVRVLVVIALLGVVGCASEPECIEFCGGTIRGTFHVGDRVISGGKFIEMIRLDGPPEERCGPHACGMAAMVLLAGTNWPPGKWRVIPPRIRGWQAPDPIVVVIKRDEVTTFEARYRPAR